MAASNAASEDKRNTNATISQVAKHAKPNQILIANSTPNAVATPFPPLKFKNIGNRCPRKTAIDTAAIKGKLSATKYCANITATVPLAASPSNVKAAAAFLPLRNTFVAPGFCDPYVRGSGKEKALLINTAKDTEPNK